MPADVFNQIISLLDVALGVTAFFLLLRSKGLSVYWPMLPITLSQVLPFFTYFFLKQTRMFTPIISYSIYFWVYWLSQVVATGCSLLLTYLVFHEVLRPLKGLLRLGTIMYRWIAFTAIAISVGIALPALHQHLGPASVIFEFQSTTAIIILSLTIFVALSVKPLGMDMRSRIFGLCLGLIVAGLGNLIQSGVMGGLRSMASRGAMIGTIANCIAECIWIYYFAVKEPERRFFLLRTTSPFHAWNEISEILGHEPGYVAIAGVPPEAFAPEELEIFRRASKNMAAIEAGDVPAKRPALDYINIDKKRHY